MLSKTTAKRYTRNIVTARQKFWRTHWRRFALITCVALAVAGLLGFRLGSLPGGVAPRELEHAPATISAGQLSRDPSYAPLMAVRYVANFLPQNVSTLRLANVLFGALALVTMFYILRRWYGMRTAIIGGVLFACSSWFLHVSRIATFDVMYLWAIPTLLAAYIALYNNPEDRRVAFGWLAVQLVVLYIPGMIWFSLVGIVLLRREVATMVRSLGDWWRTTLWAVMGLVLLVPLVVGLVRGDTLHLLLKLAGLPSSIPSGISALKGGAASLLFVFVRTPADPVTWLGQLPALGAFTAAMLIGGIFFYTKHVGAARTQLLLLYGLLGLVLTAAGGETTRSVIVPLLYLVAAGGIAYILHLWFQVFPRNILARRLAIGLMTVAIGFACFYNLRSYFVAWPHNTDTLQTFVLDYPAKPANSGQF